MFTRSPLGHPGPRALAALLLLAATPPALAQPVTSTTFSYQGRLLSAGQPVTGVYDMRFRLYDVATGGAPLGLPQCRDNVTVTNGVFTVTLDYGEAFAAPVKHLEIELRPDTGLTCIDATGLQLLTPRQPLTAAPLSTYSLSAQFAGAAATANSATTASTAANAANLNSQPASFYTSATNLSSGTLPDARLSANVAQLNLSQTFTAPKSFASTVAFTSPTSPFAVSSPSLVTNLNADLLDGLSSAAFAPASHTHDAAAIVSGILADARLSTNIPRLNAGSTFTGSNVFAANTGFTLNVGVGTISPTSKLHINDGTNIPATLSAASFAPLKITDTGGNALLMDANQIESVNGPLYLNFRSSPTAQDIILAGGGGRVGIGGNPSAPLEIFTSPSASLQFRTDGPVPGLTVDTLGGNAGVLRFRNGLEVWPNNAGTVAGKVDVRNTTGNATITLDGATGNATYANQPAVAFAQTARDPRSFATALSVAAGTFATLETINPNVPAAGLLVLTATADVRLVDVADLQIQSAWLKIEDTTGASPIQLVEVGKASFGFGAPNNTLDQGPMNISWVVPVNGPGIRRFRTVLTVSNDGGTGNPAAVYTTTLNAVFIPRGM